MSLKQKYDYVVIRNNQSIGLSRCAYEYVLQLEQKQKEFVKYLEENIDEINFRTILAKYKEIIGGENESRFN